MRELNLHNREAFFPAIIREVKKTKLIASIHPHKGHTCFELNVKTGALKPADIQEKNCTITGAKKHKVITREDCIYAAALNRENAQKKFFAHLRSSPSPLEREG